MALSIFTIAIFILPTAYAQSSYSYEGVNGYVYSGPHPGTTPLYRYFNHATGDHLYPLGRDDTAEAKVGYAFEGIRGYVYAGPHPGTTPLYRYFNHATGDHLYPLGRDDPSNARAGYYFEGINGYVYPGPVPFTLPLYRYLNTINFHHFYILAPYEIESVNDFFPSGVATGNINDDPKPDITILYNVKNSDHSYYRIGYDISNTNSAIMGGSTGPIPIPPGGPGNNIGIAIANINDDPKPDIVTLYRYLDPRDGEEHYYYRIGYDISNTNSAIMDGWTGPISIPPTGFDNDRVIGIAIANINGDPRQEIVIVGSGIDPRTGNPSSYYRIGYDISNTNSAIMDGWTGPISLASGVPSTNLTTLGYEKGTYNSAWEWNCKEDTSPNNRLEQLNNPVIEGSHALNATLTKDAIRISSGERAEVRYCDPQQHANLFVEGNSVWYHWYTMLPNNTFTTIPSTPQLKEWHTLTQWHGLRTGEDTAEERTSMGVPLALGLNVGQDGNNIFNIRVAQGLYDGRLPKGPQTTQFQTCQHSPKGYYSEDCGFIWKENNPKKGKWYEFLLHVKWSQTDGLVDGVVRVDGASRGTPSSIHYKGPTLNPFLDETTQSTVNDAQVYIKQGLYRDAAIDWNQSVYHDGMKIAICPSDHDKNYDPVNNLCIG